MSLFAYYLGAVKFQDPRSVVTMQVNTNDFDGNPYFNSALPRIDKKYTDIMADLETLDTIPSAAILSIGAVAFNLDEQESVKDYLYGVNCTARSFEVTVDLGNQVQWDRRTINGDTLRWWLAQSDAARKEVTKKGETLWWALEQFQLWVHEVESNANETRLWGNGATFDNAILRDAYGKGEIVHPIRYRNDMCYRTLKTMFMPGKVEIEDQSLLTSHNARHDAIFQAVVLQKLWAKIKPEMIGS